MIAQAGAESLWGLHMHLRPHHLASDFSSLRDSAKKAFEALAAQHQCSLLREVPAIIIDGKWCMQVSLCNDRADGKVWNHALGLGFLTGCTARPQRGSKYCSRHQMILPDTDTEVPKILEHRETPSRHDISMEYKLEGSGWMAADAVSAAAVRAYELNRLPQVSARKTAQWRVAEDCSKSGGLLVAVTPCLHIVGVQTMTSTESVTQVVLFVHMVQQYLRDIAYVVYDYACGVRRFLRPKVEARAGSPEAREWQKLWSLQWLVDRLHFAGHTGCRNPESSFYDPDVNPHAAKLLWAAFLGFLLCFFVLREPWLQPATQASPKLRGVDTEAAEQIFHVANRWQGNLSAAHQVHFELQMFLFCHEHNERQCCSKALSIYRRQQARTAVAEPCPNLTSGGCCEADRPRKARRAVPPLPSCSSGDVVSAASSPVRAPCAEAATLVRADLDSELVLVNWASRTVHAVVAVIPKVVRVRCSWTPPYGARAVRVEQLDGEDLFSCGGCFQSRMLLQLD